MKYLLAAFTIVAFGCSSNQPTVTKAKFSNDEGSPLDYKPARIIEKEKGCFLTLVGSDTLSPLVLDSAYHQNNLLVWMKFRPVKPVGGFCPGGTPIRIEGIRKRKK